MTAPGLYKPREDIDLQAWRVPLDMPSWDDAEFEALLNWMNANGGRPKLTRHVGSDGPTHWFDLVTVHGPGRAEPGIWIVLGTVGFFVRTDEQFHADYVSAEQ